MREIRPRIGEMNGQKPLLLLFVFLGLGLSGFALRQMIAALATIPSNSAVTAAQLLNPVPETDLDGWIENETRALSVLETGSDWSNLSLALAMKGGAMTDPDRRKVLFVRADGALQRSLRLSPANPYAWERLALLRQAFGAEPRDVINAWRMSILTGPNEDRLWIQRVRTAIDNWATLTDADQQAAFADIQHAWNRDPMSVVDIAVNPFTINVIRAALVADFINISNYERALRDRHRL
jgi:hypothetical protein